MTPPDKSSTESRMHTLLADFKNFKKSIDVSDRARVSVEPTVSSQKIRRSILKNRERTSPHRDTPEDRLLKRVRFEPAPGGPLKESVLSGAHVPGKSIASWPSRRQRSLRGKVKPDERQSRPNGGNSPRSMKNKDHIEALGTEVKSLKRELQTMRSCRSDARSSEQDR